MSVKPMEPTRLSAVAASRIWCWRRAAHRQRWAPMSELFAVFDSGGNQIGVAPRVRVHREGLWHRAANVFLYRADGRFLIQRRQNEKDVWPASWDLSVAEHLQLEESFAEAAARGLREELGIEQVELEPLGGVVTSMLEVEEKGIKDYEFQQSFRAVFDGPVLPCPEEVAEVRLVTLHELAAEIAERPNCYTPWFRERATELGILSSGVQLTQ